MVTKTGWLYTTPKLELCWVWSAEVSPILTMPHCVGDAVESLTYYRLSPKVYAKLIQAGDDLDERFRAGIATEAEVVEYVRLMCIVGHFVREHIDREQIEAALGRKTEYALQLAGV